MQTNTRNKYHALLRQSLPNNQFYQEVGVLLDQDRYFTPGYLEMLWHAERRHDTFLYKKILHEAIERLSPIFTNPKARAAVNEQWTQLEKDALLKLLALARAEHDFISLRRHFISLQMYLADQLINCKTKTSPTSQTFLRLEKQINPAPLQAELAGLSEYWWQMSTIRRELNVNHQDTWAVELRSLKQLTRAYEPQDGVHESVVTNIGEALPAMHNAILEFANERKLGLGRVAFVAMRPYAQSYRHYDDEENLMDRNRYHLVVQSGTKNLLSSGDEEVWAKPGDIWLFDNKAMHRAHNYSSMRRYHLIFDGYPLKKQQTNSN